MTNKPDPADDLYTALTGQPKKQLPKFVGTGRYRIPVPEHYARFYPSGDLDDDWSSEDEERELTKLEWADAFEAAGHSEAAAELRAEYAQEQHEQRSLDGTARVAQGVHRPLLEDRIPEDDGIKAQDTRRTRSTRDTRLTEPVPAVFCERGIQSAGSSMQGAGSRDASAERDRAACCRSRLLLVRGLSRPA